MKFVFHTSAGASALGAAALLWLSAHNAFAAPPLDQLACAAGVHCASRVTPTDAQVILNLTEVQAHNAFLDASQDWPDHVWRCAAGGRTCGKLSQLDAQTLIGLAEEAYGPAEQLRARGPQTEPTEPTPARKPTPPTAPRNPPIVVENLPKPGPGTFREVPIGNGVSSDEIQPLDGQWTMVFGATKTVGCMAGIAENVGKGMPGPQSGPKVFEKPFQASGLIKNPSVIWRRIAANHHEAQIVAGGNAMAMSYDLRVLNPSQMQGNSLVTVRIPGQPVCTVSTPFSYRRQGG